MEETQIQDTPKGVDITPNQDGGVYKFIKKEGYEDSGPSKNNKVYVHYTGRLLDGTKFDSSVDRNEKFTFNLGKGEVIKAWDLGVASMKKGEVCELTCRADYAYGERGSPPTIPANATLVFEVELFEWEGEDISDNKDKGIIRTVIKDGEGYSKPNEEASVKILMKGSYNGNVFDEREVDFIVGDIEDKNIPSALNKIVKEMTLGEESDFTVAPAYAFGASGNADFNIPANAAVNYFVKLISFEKSKEAWEMDDQEKLEQSAIAKQMGTDSLKSGNVARAIKKYEKVTSLLASKEKETDEEVNKKWDEMKVAANLNLALCYMKTAEYSKVVEKCGNALEIDQSNEKALYRRGEAYFNIKYYEEAKADFVKVNEVNPNNKLASKKAVQCTRALKEIQEKEKKTFKGMFDKFARQDEKDSIKKKKLMQAAKKNAGDNAINNKAAKENGESEHTNGQEETKAEETPAVVET